MSIIEIIASIAKIVSAVTAVGVVALIALCSFYGVDCTCFIVGVATMSAVCWWGYKEIINYE